MAPALPQGTRNIRPTLLCRAIMPPLSLQAALNKSRDSGSATANKSAMAVLPNTRSHDEATDHSLPGPACGRACLLPTEPARYRWRQRGTGWRPNTWEAADAFCGTGLGQPAESGSVGSAPAAVGHASRRPDCTTVAQPHRGLFHEPRLAASELAFRAALGTRGQAP